MACKPHKQISMKSNHAKFKDGGYVMKPEDYVDEEAKRAAADKARNEQIKADEERMKKLYPEKKK